MSNPIDLYRIVMGSQVWTLTPIDTDQYYDAGSGTERYVSTTLGRGQIEQKAEINKASVDVNLPLDHSLAVNLLSSFSEQILTLTIFTDRDGQVETTWKGRLASLKPDDPFITLTFESIFTSLRRPGLRAHFMRSCRHALYGRGCNLDPEDFAVDATLNAIVGTTLTVPEAALQPNGFYLGGMVRAPDGTLGYVVTHVGSALTLQRVPYPLTTAFAASGPGLAIKIYPGCDLSRTTCINKFNNLLNYGGFDWIPNINPMGGDSIV